MVSTEAALKTSVALLVTHHREFISHEDGRRNDARAAATTIVNLLYILEILNVQQTERLQHWVKSWETIPCAEDVEQEVLDLIAEA